MRKLPGLCFVIALLFCLSRPIQAANATWNGGGGDDNWTTAGNWGGTAPSAGDALFFGGAVRLSPKNTFAAGTVFGGITFNVGAGAFNVDGNSLTLGGNLASNSANAETISLPLALNANRNVNLISTTGNLTLAGIVSDGGSNFGLALNNNTATLKTNGAVSGFTFGTLTLSNANSYTGATLVPVGQLKLDFAAATAPLSNIVSGSSALTLGSASTAAPGNGALLFSAKNAANTQTFSGTTIGIGANTITATSAGTAIALNLGTLSRPNTGGVVNITLPAAGTISATGTLSNGILGGWATVGGASWATITGGNIASFTGFTTIATGVVGATDGTTAANNVDYTATTAQTITGATGTTTDINTLRVASNTAVTFTVTTGSTLRLGPLGGIFRSSIAGTNAVTIAGGTLTAGGPTANAPGELTINANQSGTNNTGVVVITSVIANNGTGAVSLIKTGPGSFSPNTSNTYTGGTYIVQGRINAGNATALGAAGGNVFIEPGGHLLTNNLSMGYNFFIAGLGSVEAAGNYGAIRTGTGTMSGVITLTGDTRLSSTGTGTYSGRITGPFNLQFGTDATNSSILIVSSTANDWTGDTTILGGGTLSTTPTLRLGASEVIPNGVGKGNVILDSSLSGNLATLDLNGKTETINGLSSAGNLANDVVTSSATGGVLIVGDTNATSTFGGVILAGSGVALTKIGSGTLTLTGANTYSSGTTISAGTLQIGSGGAAGTIGTGAIANNGILIFNRTGSLAVSSAISGTGSVQQLGGLTLTLSGANSFGGGMTLSAGTLNINSNTALGAASSVFTIAGGTTIDNTSGAAITLANNNPQNWNGDFTFTGTSGLNQGTGAVTLNANRIVTVGGNSLTVGGAISGAFGLTKLGAGALVLNGVNTYNGATTVNAGTLAGAGTIAGSVTINAGATLSAGDPAASPNTLTLSSATNPLTAVGNAGLTFRVNSPPTLVPVPGTNDFISAPNGTVTLSSTNILIVSSPTPAGFTSGTYRLISAASITGTPPQPAALPPGFVGTVAITNGGTALDLTVTLGKVWTGLGADQNWTTPGNWQGNSAPLGNGTDTLLFPAGPTQLIANNNFAAGTSFKSIGVTGGGYTIQGNALQVTAPANAFNVLTSSGDTNINLVIGGTGGLTTSTSGGTVILNANNTFSGVTTISGGILQLGNGGTSGSLGTGDVTGTATLAVNRSDAILISNTITGAVSVLQNSPASGVLTLSGTSSYGGVTTVNSATLKITAPGALGNSAVTVASGATLDVSTPGTVPNALTINGTGLGGNGAVIVNNTSSWNGALTVGTATTGVAAAINVSAGQTFTLTSTLLTANFALTKLGAGTFVLGSATGNITAGTGALNLNAGTFSIASGTSRWNSGDITVNASATLQTTGGGGDSIGNALKVTVNAGGVFDDQQTGTETVSSLALNGDGIGGTGAWVNTGTIAAGAFTATNGIVLGSNTTVGGTGNVTAGSIISGGFSLTKVGTGTFALTALNTYSGGTTVNAGTLSLGVGGGTGTITGVLTINTGGTVTTTATDAIGFTVGLCVTTVNINGGTFNNGVNSNQGFSTNFNLTGGILSSTGGGGINFNTGFGIATLASPTTSLISAPIVIRAGSIPFTVATGTTATGIDLNVTGVISGATFGLIKAGTGTMALTTAVSTYTGATVINAGTLQLNTANGAGSQLATPSITVNSTGTLALNAADVLGFTANRNALIINGGTVTNITAAGRITIINNITMTGGTLTGTGAGDVNGQYSLFSGAGFIATSDATGIPAVISAKISPQTTDITFNVTRGAATPASDLNITAPIIVNSAFGIIKTGTGILTLSGANTYTGQTNISAGTVIASNIVFTAGSSNFGNAATPVFLGGAATQGVLSYTGSSATFVRGFTIGAGGGEIDTTTAGQVLTISTGAINNAANGLLTVGGAGDTAISSVIGAGTGGLTKTGAGTLTLNGFNTYSGATTVSGGALRGIGSINTSAVTVGTGAVMWPGSALAVGALAIDENLGAGSANLSAGKLNIVINNSSGNKQSLTLAAGGALTLGGSSTLSLAFNTPPTQPLTYTIATAPGGIVTAFASVLGITGYVADGVTHAVDIVYHDQVNSANDRINPALGSTLTGGAFTQVLVRFNNTSVTPVTVESIAASRDGAGVALEWTCVSEFHNAGFNVYRRGVEAAEWARVNPTLIAGRITDAEAKTYRVYDWAPSGTYVYRLDSISIAGVVETYATIAGPVEVDGAAAAEVNRASDESVDSALGSVTLAAAVERGQVLSQKFAAQFHTGTVARELIREDVATADLGASVRAQAGSENSSVSPAVAARWFSASTPATSSSGIAVKAVYSAPGILSISQSSLPKGFNIHRVSVAREGRAVTPLAVTGTELLLYGPGYADDYTDKDVFFLRSTPRPTVAGRTSTASGLYNGSQAVNTTTTASVAVQYHDVYFDFSLRPYTFQPWFSSQYLTDGSVQAFTLATPFASSGSGTLTLNLWSLTQDAASVDHNIQVVVNGAAVGQALWKGGSKAVQLSFEVPPGVLTSGVNQIELITPALGGVASQIAFVQSMTMTYARALDGSQPVTVVNNSAGTKLFEVGNLPSAAAWVVDARYPDRAVLVPTETRVQQDGTYTLRFEGASGGTGAFLVVPSGQENRPIDVRKRQVRSLGKCAYLATGPADFGAGVQPLLAAHSKEGLRGLFADQEQLFDYYNYGRYGPVGIQNAVRAVRLKYLLLLGRTTYDYRNYSGLNVDPMCPAFLVSTSFWSQATSDAMFGDLGRGYAEVAVGRLPVNNAAELSSAVRHVLDYAGAPSSGIRVQAIADQIDPATADFPAQAAALSGALPELAWQPNYLGVTYQTAPEVTSAMTAGANGGADWLLYVGHGNASRLGRLVPRILDTDRVQAWTGNVVFLQSTCTANWAAGNQAEFTSIAVQALTQPQGGISASIASSTYMNSEHATAFMSQLMKNAAGGARWGDALMKTQQWAHSKAGAAGGFYGDLSATEQIFGDPAMKIFAPARNPAPGKPAGNGGAITPAGTF